MANGGGPDAARQAHEPAGAFAQGDATEAAALDEFGDGAEAHPETEQQSERHQRDGHPTQRGNEDGEEDGERRKAHQPLSGRHQIGALPSQ